MKDVQELYNYYVEITTSLLVTLREQNVARTKDKRSLYQEYLFAKFQLNVGKAQALGELLGISNQETLDKIKDI